MNDVKGFEDYKAEKKPGSVSINKKKMRRYVKRLKDIVDFYNPQSGNLPILLAQIEAGNNSINLKNEARQILYSLYRSKVLTKTVYNNLIKSIRE